MLARLLVHEIRLGLRLGQGAARWRWFAGLLVLAAAPIALGWAAARGLAQAPDMPGPAMLSLLVATHLLMLPLMASLAAVQVLRAFHDRNDLDLLLAAPISPQQVFLAKALAVCWLVAMPFLVLLGPFVLASMLHGHWRWGGSLVVLLATATIATGLGFLLVAMLLAWLGARRARVVVHLGSAALGASVFIASQASALGSRVAAGREQLLASLAAALPPPPLDFAARAMLGAPLPLLALVGLAAAALAVAAGPAAAQLSRRHMDPDRKATAGRQLFTASPLLALLRKELLLLRRDLEVLAQVLLRFIYLVPLVLLALQDDARPDVSAVRLLAGGVALAAMAASSLAWITLCAEEAPELLDAAPVASRARHGAKLAIACLLPLLALAPLAVWVATLDATAGLLFAPMALAAAASMALVQGWHAPRLPRNAFRKRPRAMLLMGLVEVLMAAAWALAASFAMQKTAALPLPLAVIAAMLLAAWLSRPKSLATWRR